jgi:hypothetical protein
MSRETPAREDACSCFVLQTAIIPARWRGHGGRSADGQFNPRPEAETLPWESHKTVCRRCKGSKTVYYASMRGGVEVIGGRRVPCPDCGGKGTVREPDQPSSL